MQQGLWKKGPFEQTSKDTSSKFREKSIYLRCARMRSEVQSFRCPDSTPMDCSFLDKGELQGDEASASWSSRLKSYKSMFGPGHWCMVESSTLRLTYRAADGLFIVKQESNRDVRPLVHWSPLSGKSQKEIRETTVELERIRGRNCFILKAKVH